MGLKVNIESVPSRRINVTSLSPLTFAPFGAVIQNPATHRGIPNVSRLEANQGSATKWLDVTAMRTYYHGAPSSKEANVVFNMFVCKPRTTAKSQNGRDESVFEVKVLERHPYTPQTFVPLALDREDFKTCYLVIVAPTLYQPKAEDGPNQNADLENDGLPDLDHVQAFIARGDQCVTYGAGTWHAPMVVLGEREIEFVVVQYANGVAEEDCQEVSIEAHGSDGGVAVIIGEDVVCGSTAPKPKL